MGYRNEIGVIMQNSDPKKHFEILEGMKIAQMVIKKVPLVFLEKEKGKLLDATERGKGGFGSTGT